MLHPLCAARPACTALAIGVRALSYGRIVAQSTRHRRRTYVGTCLRLGMPFARLRPLSRRHRAQTFPRCCSRRVSSYSERERGVYDIEFDVGKRAIISDVTAPRGKVATSVVEAREESHKSRILHRERYPLSIPEISSSYERLRYRYFRRSNVFSAGEMLRYR